MNINDFKLPEFKTYFLKIANDFNPFKTYFDEISLITCVPQDILKTLYIYSSPETPAMFDLHSPPLFHSHSRSSTVETIAVNGL